MFAVIWYYKFIVIWNGTYPVLWDFTYSIFWYFTFIRIPLSDIFAFLLFGFTFLSYKNALQIFFLRFLASYVSYYVIYFTYPAIWYFSYPTIWYVTFIRILLSRSPPLDNWNGLFLLSCILLIPLSGIRLLFVSC